MIKYILLAVTAIILLGCGTAPAQTTVVVTDVRVGVTHTAFPVTTGMWVHSYPYHLYPLHSRGRFNSRWSQQPLYLPPQAHPYYPHPREHRRRY